MSHRAFVAAMILSLSAVPAVAADSAAATLSATPPGVVDGATAQRLVAAGARLVDVRTQQEFDAGHLPGAVLIPFDQIVARAAELGSKETPVLLYCRTGRRTGIAARALSELGFTRVWDLQGMTNWPASGR